MPNIVKNTTLIGLLDLLAPHSCRGCGHIGNPLCDCCKNYIISSRHNYCPICHTPNSNGKCTKCANLPPIFITGPRSDLIGDLIHDYKFNANRSLARPLAELLNSTIPATNNSIIIPLPTISRHIRERGFDHTHLIAKHFSSLRPRCHLKRLITRASDTVQVGSSRDARLTQASHAYTINNNAKFNTSTTYILFDDVWTTGASLQAAYALLRQAGASNIIIAALALSS